MGTSPFFARSGSSPVLAALVFLFGLALFLPGAGARSFWGNDENRYAVVARHMAEDGGSFSLLELHGEPYAEKPPFLFWCVTASSRLLGGLDERSARLPVAVFGALTLVVTHLFAGAAIGARAALVAPVLLGGAGEFFWLSRRLAFDPILAFFETAAAFSFFLGFERGSRRAFFAAFAAMALGILTKGPVGLVVPLLGAVAFAVVSGPRSLLKEVPWIRGSVIVVAVLAVWLVPAALEGGAGFLKRLVVDQQVGRTTGELGHTKPLTFYLEAFPAGFLPWTPLLAAAPFLARAFRAGPERRGVAFAAAWFVAGFVFFSLVKTKRNLYLIPLYPAAALLAAAALDAGMRGAAGRRLSALVASYPAALLAACGAGGIAAPFVLPRLLPVSAGQALLAFALAGVPALAGFALFLRRRGGDLVALAATVLGCGLFSGLVLLPARDGAESNAGLARAVAAMMAPGDRLVAYRIQPDELLFYTGLREVVKADGPEALERLRGAPERLVVVAEDRHEAEVRAAFGDEAAEVARTPGDLGGVASAKDILHVFVTR